MKILYFDCFSGISGDMTMAALLDLGIDREKFKNELYKLNLDGYRIVIGNEQKNGISGTDVRVLLDDEQNHVHEEYDHHMHEHNNDCHDSIHEHQHEHRHDHAHEHSHEARNLKDIEDLIDNSGLKQNVKEFSKKVFEEIARAEAKVHNKDINEVHFHEVGAVDSIVDIVGVAICLDMLQIDRVYSSPLHDGHGFIECQHGTIPVPVPAVMEMLTGSRIPLISEDVGTELVTPTGMGIIKCLAAGFGSMPAMTIDKAGYGMGKRDTGKFNALRIVMGTLLDDEEEDNEKAIEGISVLETNIDDMSPEILGYVSECLLENGALDVFYTPIYMKKNRPSVMLTVISEKEQESRLADIIMKETSTLGIRRRTTMRYFMQREVVTVETGYGKARVKIAASGDIKKFAPEYEDCRAIAKKTGMPLREVYNIVSQKASQLL